MLTSRKQFKSSEEFRDQFLKTLTPGIIPRKNFIDWAQIDNKFDKYEPVFEFYRELGRLSRTEEEFYEEYLLGVLSSDNPKFLIETGFQLLGHTNNVYVSNQDYLKLSSIDDYINSKNKKDTGLIESFIETLCDLGLRSVVKLQLLENYFIGVQVGLETNRRKNIGGEAFKQVLKIELETIIKKIGLAGFNFALKEEDKILYSDNKTSKRVDFSIKYKEKIIGIEANFYTVSGSKPTEIKRSYGQVNKELQKMGVELVWITDGAGYFDMKNSLKEARDIHKNIYNLKMLKKDFETDLKKYFEI
ncbi:MAG: DpnII family type II restriction endonuclease [Patescibacteria group bacterium]|nr:DpnII family type II restriction endonuclease [Patescibacteria group bacterium]